MLNPDGAFLKPALVNLVTGLLCVLILASCSEKKKIEAESNRLKQEIESYRTQLQTINADYASSAKLLITLKAQQPTRSKTSSQEDAILKLETEMNSLLEREKNLEQTVKRLTEAVDKYKKYSP